MRPLIGVTTSELRRGELATLRRHGEPPHAEMALGMTYLRAHRAAGGVPVVLPPLRRRARRRCSTASTASACPAARTSTPPPTAPATPRELGPTEPSLDAFELELARARRRARPAAPRHLPRRPGAQRRPRRHAAPARRRPPPDRARPPSRRTRCSVDAALARCAASLETRALAGQLLPPPGGRRARRAACAPSRARAGRHDRGDRGPPAPFLLGVQWHAETLVDAHRRCSRRSLRAAARSRSCRAAA